MGFVDFSELLKFRSNLVMKMNKIVYITVI